MRLEASLSLPSPRWPHNESISSMKIMEGALSRAIWNKFETSFSLSPIHFETRRGWELTIIYVYLKKVESASVATAFARYDFPVPEFSPALNFELSESSPSPPPPPFFGFVFGRAATAASPFAAGNDPKANPKEIMQQEKEHKPRKMGTRTWIKGKKQANDSCGVRDGKFERKKVSYS
nr:Os02g0159950 [Ipomoea trifida]